MDGFVIAWQFDASGAKSGDEIELAVAVTQFEWIWRATDITADGGFIIHYASGFLTGVPMYARLNELYGTDGHDIVYAQFGNSRMFSRTGDDQIYGSAGKDLLDGRTGAGVHSARVGTDARTDQRSPSLIA